MKFQFDHVVHYVTDPNEMIGEFKTHGLHAVEGGQHVNSGTYNSLCYFGLSYIEFLGTYDRELVLNGAHPRNSLHASIVEQQFNEGFMRFALRTVQMESAATHFRRLGLEVHGPYPLSRKRPDGKVLEWDLLFIGDGGNLNLPFIIQWKESDEERRRDLINQGSLLPHPADVQLSHLSIAVQDAQATAKKWQKYFGGKLGSLYEDKDLQASCLTLELDGGTLLFCSPLNVGNGQDYLEQKGEKPFKLTLNSPLTEDTFTVHGGHYVIAKQ
ncbi:VOC family protein [Bacillus sp. 1P06AnD]|uniref:VOC family protein n=1 Tax=Bacillus sp. 1P06AnD TaxID=3132208 RepID=UPI0039A3F223